MKTIIVDFPDADSVEIRSEGFRGNACKIETADLEKALGAKVSDTPTREAALPDVPERLNINSRG